MPFRLKRAVDQKTRLHKKIETLEKQLTLATHCLEEISKGNLEFELNADTFSDDGSQMFMATLLKMQKQLKTYAQQEKERSWITDGIAKFMELVKGEKREDFYDRVLALMVKYTQANQGAVFLLNDQDPEDAHLELVSCYAYSKKKFTTKRVEIGQGLLGQCFLEKNTHATTEVPPFYTTITSGLGEATPGFLLLIPLKYDDQVLGVIEMAYFIRLKQYQIEFIEKIAENIATVTLNIHHTTKAAMLFDESQEKARILREQEETLRQNVEELTATQEEMRRNQAELDRQTQFLKFILDNLPFPVFVKDERSCYTLVNRAETALFNLAERDLIGKNDKCLVSREAEWQQIRESDERALNSSSPLEIPMQHFTTLTGRSYVFNTTKIPFINKATGQKNILGVSIDITEKLKIEQAWLREKDLNRHNTFINVAGRQRMLSQKIGFYAGILLRGKKEHSQTLRYAIELYDHSLNTIRFGGMPIDMHCDAPLPGLQRDLFPRVEKIEKLWAIYKQAAENILYFTSLETTNGSGTSGSEANIQIIENKAEDLLTLNNDLINAYLQLHVQNHNALASSL